MEQGEEEIGGGGGGGVDGGEGEKEGREFSCVVPGVVIARMALGGVEDDLELGHVEILEGGGDGVGFRGFFDPKSLRFDIL